MTFDQKTQCELEHSLIWKETEEQWFPIDLEFVAKVRDLLTKVRDIKD